MSHINQDAQDPYLVSSYWVSIRKLMNIEQQIFAKRFKMGLTMKIQQRTKAKQRKRTNTKHLSSPAVVH